MNDLHEQPFQSVFFDPEGIVPGPGGKPVSRQGEVVDKERFEKMKSEYYNLRGWDERGFPTGKTLKELELGDIADELQKSDLVV